MTLALLGCEAESFEGSIVRVMHASGEGTGFVVGPNHVMTAAHVVATEDMLTVIERDGQSQSVKVAWSEPSMDVALLYLPQGTGRKPLKIHCELAEAGAEIVTVGHPYVLSFMWRYGRVASGVQGPNNADAPARVQLAQVIDMMPVPGMSGGPVVHLHSGKVIGMIVAGINMPTGMFSSSPTGFSLMIPGKQLCEAADIHGRWR